jgi:hypothetical protein
MSRGGPAGKKETCVHCCQLYNTYVVFSLHHFRNDEVFWFPLMLIKCN